MKINFQILLCAFTFFSALAYAECGTNSCDAVYVDKLYIATTGMVYVGTSGTETSLTCPAEAGVYLTLNLALPGANAIYSTLLTAQTANKRVSVRVDETSPGCKILYMTIDKQ